MTTPHELPGNPDVVRSTARSYTATADAVTRAAQQIRNLATGASTSTSDAVKALADNAGDVADRLGKLHERYSVAGSALSTYGDALATVKQSSRVNAESYHSAVYAHDHAQGQIDHYTHIQRTATEVAQMHEASEMVTHWVNQRSYAQQDITTYISRHTHYETERDDAANSAQQQIDGAVDNDGLNDSMWDNIKGWVAEHAEFLKKLKEALSWITTGLSVLSLFFPVLAPFALAAAVLTTGLSLLLAASGEESWVEFGLDALALVTIGVGSVAGRTAKEALTGLKGLRVARVAAKAGSKSPLRVVTGSFNSVQMGKISLNSLRSVKGLANLRDIYLYGGIENANAFRVFTRAVAGSGPLDSWALKPGMQAMMALRASAWVDPGVRALELATGVDSPLSDGYEKLNRATTMEVGSGW